MVPDLTIVIPVYNEFNVLTSFYSELSAVLDNLPESWECIFVDDGSDDGSFDFIEALAGRDDRVYGRSFSRNFGKEAAIWAGLQAARGKAVIVMDADGQHPPSILPEMVRIWRNEQTDLVCAVKRKRTADSFLSKCRARLFNEFLSKTTGLDMSNASDFQLLDRKVVKLMLELREKNRFFRGLTQWSGFDCQHVPFDVNERIGGVSKWSIWQLGKLAVDAITSFTSKPLLWIFGLGLGGVGLSMALVIQSLWSRLTGVAVSGWTSLTILILFFGSANLMALGVLGIYLARVFEEVKNRPAFIIKKETGRRDTDKIESDKE